MTDSEFHDEPADGPRELRTEAIDAERVVVTDSPNGWMRIPRRWLLDRGEWR